MRYVTHYEEYPIYEAAEGGYYYSGNKVVESERLSKHKCKKILDEIWEDCKQYNLAWYGAEVPETDKDEHGNRIYPWVRINMGDGIRIVKGSRYIGEGESYIIERCKGSETKGWHPYC